MHIRDNSKAQGWFRKHAAAPSSIGSWKAFVARNKTVQEPRTMAQGGRIGFFKGESVIKSSGQEIIDLVEAGESSVSIAKKLKLKQQTVNNALNSIDQGLAGEKYKLSKPLKELYAPKNQYTGKLLTEDMDLVNAIKKDAETMSQIEVEKKYNKKLSKSSLQKLKDKHKIEFRKSYLPEGTQKKSIPYQERFSYLERQEMYKKRKLTETDVDRENARLRKKKYQDKIYAEYKMEPSSRGFKDDLWKDIARSSNEGDRIKLIEGPKYSSGTTYDKFKTRRFLDTKTGVEFGYNDLEKYLDSGKLKDTSFAKASEPYRMKWAISKSGMREEINKAYFGEKYKPPSLKNPRNAFNVHHLAGVASDPFNVQLTFVDENLGLITNKKFNKEWANLVNNNASLTERKNFLKNVKSRIGPNTAQTLDFPEVGKTRTWGSKGSDLTKMLSDLKIGPKNQEIILKTYQNAGIGKNCKAYGGRVNFQDAGAVGVSQCMKNAIDEHNKNLKSEDLTVRNAARSKQFNINKTKNMKNILNLGGKGVSKAVRFGKSLGIEFEPIFEGAFYEWGRRNGYTHEQALEETFFAKMLPEEVQKDVLGAETKTGIWEGAEPLLEKELIGTNEVVQRYVNNEKALMAAQQKYNDLYRAHQVATEGERGYGIDPEKVESSAKALEATWEEMNMLEDKLDLDRDTYQAAVEKQQHTQGMRAFEYGEYGSGDTEKLAKQRERRRQREMEEKFPLMSKLELNKQLEDVGLYVDPKLRYKGQTVQRPEGLKKLTGGWTTDKARDYFRDLDKSAYFADNFRMEKAGGGIAGIRRPNAIPPESGPTPYGLPSMLNRVKKV